jgi:hypothetical protein
MYDNWLSHIDIRIQPQTAQNNGKAAFPPQKPGGGDQEGLAV